MSRCSICERWEDLCVCKREGWHSVFCKCCGDLHSRCRCNYISRCNGVHETKNTLNSENRSVNVSTTFSHSLEKDGKKVIWVGVPCYGAYTFIYEDLSIEVPGYNSKYIAENHAEDAYKAALKDLAKERDELKEAARKVF